MSADPLAAYLDDLIEGAAFADTGAEAAEHVRTVLRWRPPAKEIETRDGIADAPTGTVLRFRGGDIGSIDHGTYGEWVGLDTWIHLLLPLGAPWLRVRDLPKGELSAQVVWSPTEKAEGPK